MDRPANQFTSGLPALSSLGGAAAFPEQLAPSAATAGLTDVLPPLGGLPGQLPAISGEAPILTPAPRQPGAPVVPFIGAPGPAAAPPDMPVLRAAQPPAEPGAPASATPTPAAPGAPAVARVSVPSLTPAPRDVEAPATGPRWHAPIGAVENTLTGNVLPARRVYPVLRELIAYAPIWRQAADDTPAAGAAPAPSDERVTPDPARRD